MAIAPANAARARYGVKPSVSPSRTIQKLSGLNRRTAEQKQLRGRTATEFARCFACGLTLVTLVFVGCRQPGSTIDPELARFAEAKRAQTKNLVAQQNLRMPAVSWGLFDAVLADDFPKATNLFARLESGRSAGTVPSSNLLQHVQAWLQVKLEKIGLRQARPPGLQSAAWHPLAEAYWAYIGSKAWSKPLREKLTEDILAVIPPGAIYFGGTDDGRFLVTAAITSHADGQPFFVLTQNQLTDGSYLEYARSMYSNQIYVPTPDDAQQAFASYLSDAERRLKSGQLKPGENVQLSGGRVNVSGATAVMEINALLTKVFFNNNPKHEVFIEQSWPLDWTYPHLIPRGPIFSINREPLARLPPTAVEADRTFWSEACHRFLGFRVTPETATSEVCDFVERICFQRNLSDFHGSFDFVRDLQAQKAFGKLRYSTADLYQWRAKAAKFPEDPKDQQRMRREALLAFHQAFALDPRTPATALGLAGALRAMDRADDARRVLETSLKFDHTNSELRLAIGAE